MLSTGIENASQSFTNSAALSQPSAVRTLPASVALLATTPTVAPLSLIKPVTIEGA